MQLQLGALDAAHVVDDKLSEAHDPKLSSNPQDVDIHIQAGRVGEMIFLPLAVSSLQGFHQLEHLSSLIPQILDVADIHGYGTGACARTFEAEYPLH